MNILSLLPQEKVWVLVRSTVTGGGGLPVCSQFKLRAQKPVR